MLARICDPTPVLTEGAELIWIAVDYEGLGRDKQPTERNKLQEKSTANSAARLWVIFEDFYVLESGGEGRPATRSFPPQRASKRLRTRVISQRTTAEMVFKDHLTPSRLRNDESLRENLGLENGKLSKVSRPMIQLGCRVLAQCSALCHPDLSTHGGRSPHDHTWPQSERKQTCLEKRVWPLVTVQKQDAGKERERRHEKTESRSPGAGVRGLGTCRETRPFLSALMTAGPLRDVCMKKQSFVVLATVNT